jgi:hypothetical protein
VHSAPVHSASTLPPCGRGAPALPVLVLVLANSGSKTRERCWAALLLPPGPVLAQRARPDAVALQQPFAVPQAEAKEAQAAPAQRPALGPAATVARPGLEEPSPGELRSCEFSWAQLQ